MACFVVPAAEAVIATVAVQIAKKHEISQEKLECSCLRALSRLLSIKFRFQESFLGFAIYFGAVFYFLPLNTFGTES
mgnify:CR=1 FL=1